MTAAELRALYDDALRTRSAGRFQGIATGTAEHLRLSDALFSSVPDLIAALEDRERIEWLALEGLVHPQWAQERWVRQEGTGPWADDLRAAIDAVRGRT